MIFGAPGRVIFYGVDVSALALPLHGAATRYLAFTRRKNFRKGRS